MQSMISPPLTMSTGRHSFWERNPVGELVVVVLLVVVVVVVALVLGSHGTSGGKVRGPLEEAFVGDSVIKGLPVFMGSVWDVC